jgi:uncharacterized protein (DUF924 family)
MTSPGAVVAFWRDAGYNAWFSKDDGFDQKCGAFAALHHAAARRELDDWAHNAEGALALCLLLDQIPRNIYRMSAHAFATDGLAQAIAERALAQNFDTATETPLRIFFYMPLEHSESLALQQRCVFLFEAIGDAEFLKYAILHRDIIARFGRFPHRNAVLGRISTAEEEDFLASGGFAG